MLTWQFENKTHLKYIIIPEWEKAEVRTAFSTRQGGFSDKPYESFNMGLHVGDKKDIVIANRALLLETLNSRIDDMVCCEQVHGAEVARVGKADAGRGAFELSTAIANCDAMISDEAGVNLVAFFADCLPLYFFDPKHRVVALAHAGWKGTMQRIAASTIEEMGKQYGCRVQDLEVFIGPGIGPCCFEIQDELAQKVEREFTGASKLLVQKHGCLTWDLARTNLQVLKDLGVPEKQIGICEVCTACRADLFFSYRRDAGLTGRMAAVIALK